MNQTQPLHFFVRRANLLVTYTSFPAQPCSYGHAAYRTSLGNRADRDSRPRSVCLGATATYSTRAAAATYRHGQLLVPVRQLGQASIEEKPSMCIDKNNSEPLQSFPLGHTPEGDCGAKVALHNHPQAHAHQILTIVIAEAAS